MRELRDILFQCNPCVMCRNNVFHCELSDTCMCNAEENWKKLIEHLNLIENDNKSIHQELDAYYDKNNAIVIGNLIQQLGYRIDRIQQPFHKANIPALWGCRLSKMSLPDDQLKKMKRVWQVGIYTETDSHGVKVFEDAELISALQKAVAYVEGEES